MVIPTRRRGGRMPLKPPPFHTSKSIVYVDCSLSTRETCSSRLCFLIQAVWFEANTQNMTTANNINFPIFFLFWWIHWSKFKSFQFLSWGAVMDWNDGDLFSLLLTYRPSTESKSMVEGYIRILNEERRRRR